MTLIDAKKTPTGMCGGEQGRRLHYVFTGWVYGFGLRLCLGASWSPFREPLSKPLRRSISYYLGD